MSVNNKKKIMQMNKIKWIAAFFFAACLAAIALPSCERYPDPPPYFEDIGDTTKPVERKVLIIGIDGAVGSEYKTIQPTVMIGMKGHSKYSWEAVSDESTTDAASWKTLMSGVSFFHHRIFDSSLMYTQPAGSSEHAPINTYPSFFTYLLTTARADTKTAFITSWPALLTHLVPEVEEKILGADDKAVKDSAVSTLKDPSSDIVVVHFNGVAKAGLQYGFSASASGYKDAVNQVDQYIGEIMTTLKNRPGYNKTEEWLVVVQGTHGGTDHSYGGPSASETNIPVFYYNERFLEKEFITSGAFSGVEISGKDNPIKAQLLNDGGVYDPGTGEQTVLVKVKGTSGSYPHFFSKMERWPSKPGWSMFTAGANWAMSIRSTTSGEFRIQSNSKPAFDGNWHTIGFTIADSGSKVWVRRYTDGIRHEVRDITSAYNNGGSIESPSPLTFGFGADPGMGASKFYTADAMIFNVALSDQEIQDIMCMQDISKHPQYAHLIGYWPGNDGFGGRLKNKAPGYHTDFILSGNYHWDALQDLPCTTVPNNSPLTENLLVKSVDLAPIFFYWLRITPADNWGLEGSNWLNRYESEFIQL